MYKKLGIVLYLVIGAMLFDGCASDEGGNSVEEAVIENESVVEKTSAIYYPFMEVKE
jgi:PBP1b-binding outer membrane lipoprotein LpoB